jgi:hypothetical protein
MPFRLSNDEVITMAEAGDGHTLVRFGCDFTLPPGWRGGVLRVLMHRELHRGPAGALARLKRAAEAPR